MVLLNGLKPKGEKLGQHDQSLTRDEKSIFLTQNKHPKTHHSNLFAIGIP